MLWFEPFPWGRWILVGLFAAFAMFVELRPDPSVEMPFATIDIAPGSVVDGSNAEMRLVPPDLFEGAPLGVVARERILAGEPVLASDVSDEDETVPPGWWVVGVAFPDGVVTGDEVRLVLLDSGTEVDGVVAHPGSDDPFAAADGGVAVPPESSADVAQAAANGRLAVLISTG
ncbi:MAG: hypothetical protein PVJ28_06050 [Acidimicrobiia bacterium]|jgi:hypothetical protein